MSFYESNLYLSMLVKQVEDSGNDVPSEVLVPVYLGKLFPQEDEWGRRVLTPANRDHRRFL